MTMSEPRRPGRPYAGGPTQTRSMRLGQVYDDAKSLAEALGETITAVVERKLTEYLEDHMQTMPPLSDTTRAAVNAYVNATVEHEYQRADATEARQAAHTALMDDLRDNYVTRNGGGDGLVSYTDHTLRILVRDGLAARTCQCRQLHPHGCPHGTASGSIWCARHYEADVPAESGALLCGTCYVVEGETN